MLQNASTLAIVLFLLSVSCTLADYTIVKSELRPRLFFLGFSMFPYVRFPDSKGCSLSLSLSLSRCYLVKNTENQRKKTVGPRHSRTPTMQTKNWSDARASLQPALDKPARGGDRKLREGQPENHHVNTYCARRRSGPPTKR